MRPHLIGLLVLALLPGCGLVPERASELAAVVPAFDRGAAAARVRARVDEVLAPVRDERPTPASVPLLVRLTADVPAPALEEGELRRTLPVRFSTRTDAALGPIDLGLPVLVDLGAGEAPFDDAEAPPPPGLAGRGGFSSSILSLTVRQPLGNLWHLRGTAAFSREQDLTVIEGLPDAEFTFAVIGVGASF